MSAVTTTRTATHWGAYDVHVEDGRVVKLEPLAGDPDPAEIGGALADAFDHPTRIERPMVRRGWLEGGPDRARSERGAEPFVPVSWEEAFELVSGELDRVRREHGNTSIYAGSYGWASAGRFHHAQSQLHRFMNVLGGCTRSVNSYSTAAAQVILPRVVSPWHVMEVGQTSWSSIAEAGELFVAFGGIPLKNAQVAYGGIVHHPTRDGMESAKARGVRFVTFGPLRDDTPEFLDHEWIACRPGSDVAIMLALAHTLETEGLVDRDFLARCTVGYERFRPYLLGETDGVAKDAEWAAPLAGVDAERLRALAREMASKRTMLSAAWSLQRGDHGEQPYWMAVVLAAMLGQVGLPGGGFGFGYADEGFIGSDWRRFKWATFDKLQDPVGFAIPVARIADMLLEPGAEVDYDGRRITYPDVKLVYWAGGNPFHHHQDLNRLLEAWKRPDTVVVHDIWWTPIARQADIVLPVTTVLEREDVSASSHDPFAVAMHQAVPPRGEARSDHAILAGIAGRLGLATTFTEGRSEREWLEHMWNVSRQRAAREGFTLPDFDTFWEQGMLELPPGDGPRVWLADFRADPEANPLPTPSGRIEIASETIGGFGYADCPEHPIWMEPYEWLGSSLTERFPLHLVSNQPAKRLHSQLDQASVSQSDKVGGRQPIRLSPTDAAARGIRDGDTVRVFNDRGACLAGARIDDALMPGVAQLATGAWFDPAEPGRAGSLELAGNPNVLTRDKGTSALAQGPSAHSCLVEVERHDGPAPAPRVYAPPPIEER